MKLLKVPFIPSPLTKKSKTFCFPWRSERSSSKDWSSDTYWNLSANEKLSHTAGKKNTWTCRESEDLKKQREYINSLFWPKDKLKLLMNMIEKNIIFQPKISMTANSWKLSERSHLYYEGSFEKRLCWIPAILLWTWYGTRELFTPSPYQISLQDIWQKFFIV